LKGRGVEIERLEKQTQPSQEANPTNQPNQLDPAKISGFFIIFL
jgi:hypothetical protein